MKLVVEILCAYRLEQTGLFPESFFLTKKFVGVEKIPFYRVISLDELVQNWVRLNLFPNVFELAVLLCLLIICYRETWTVSAEL